MHTTGCSCHLDRLNLPMEEILKRLAKSDETTTTAEPAP